MTVRTLSVKAVVFLSALALTFSATVALAPLASAATTIPSAGPTSGIATTTTSTTFTDQLGPTTFNNQQVTFVTTNPNAYLSVSSTGTVSTVGGPLPANVYSVSGTDNDGVSAGDTGSWKYTLLVIGVNIPQRASLGGATTVANSPAFTDQLGPTTYNNQQVTFVTTNPNAYLSVSSTGTVSTVGGPLPAKAYTVSGTDANGAGDTGTWKYTLIVSSIFTTVTFKANGGKGSMTPERHDSPTALVGNRFTRSKYTFVGWNRAANGSGTSYTNGATYPFTRSTTLYAQWKVGKVVAHSVSFNPNGGVGTMAVERENKPTGLTPNRFTRSKYTFVGWNRAANGSGTSYTNGATYPFTRSTTLYAQWKIARVPSKSVTFVANGGIGVMTPESHSAAASLTLSRFTRSGYNFVGWSTAVNGSGASYANGAPYPFTTSTTLYAQWRHKPIPKPAIHATAVVGPFAIKSTTLSPSIEAQVSALATEIKANRDTKIVLVGYGDKLSARDQLNESLWVANITRSQNRASAVASYLRERLAALGLNGYTITAQGTGAITSGSSSRARQSRSDLVVATLS